jgi:hypothetical protein
MKLECHFEPPKLLKVLDLLYADNFTTCLGALSICAINISVLQNRPWPILRATLRKNREELFSLDLVYVNLANIKLKSLC